MSGVFVVQGNLGGGKSLYCVSKAVPAIRRGLRVATNINLNMSVITGKNSKKSYTRLPDKPKKSDLEMIGRGCREGSPEDDFGLIILDECAHWLNARNWSDKSNQEMIQFLLYIRKLGWKVYFLIQNIKALDKQARELFAEHVVTCRRTDRMRIPVVSWLFSQLDMKVGAPKVHVASIRYGSGINAPLVGTDLYRGKEFYPCYDTNQIFTDQETYSYCSVPNYLKKRAPKTTKGKLIMGLTKIHFARHNITALLIMLAVIMYAFLNVYVFMPKFNDYKKERLELVELIDNQDAQIVRLENLAQRFQEERAGKFTSVDSSTGSGLDERKTFEFDSRIELGGIKRVFFKWGDEIVNSDQLVSMGFTLKDRDCSYLIQNLQTQEAHLVNSPCS